MPERTSSIRLFPHSENEFQDVEDLAAFMEIHLRAKGVYHVVTATKYSGLQEGDLVIFHKNRRFVGEARIAKKLRRFPRPKKIEGGVYEGQIEFAPESVRVYAPTFDEVEAIAGLEVNTQAIQHISVCDYQTIRGLR